VARRPGICDRTAKRRSKSAAAFFRSSIAAIGKLYRCGNQAIIAFHRVGIAVIATFDSVA
jgi:hypothetical protein